MFMKVIQFLQNVQSVTQAQINLLPQSDERTWAAEHVVGVAKGVSEDILSDLRAEF